MPSVGFGGGGGSSTWRTEIPVLSFVPDTGSVATAGYLANGNGYLPLTVGYADAAYGDFVSEYTGNIELVVYYSMSASNGGNVKIKVSSLAIGDAESPAGDLTAGTAFTVTPGSNTTMHSLDSSDDSSLLIAVTAGDIVTFKIERVVSGDTHTGDFRILRVLARQV